MVGLLSQSEVQVVLGQGSIELSDQEPHFLKFCESIFIHIDTRDMIKMYLEARSIPHFK